MSTNTNHISIALFGSRARGDYDDLSDTDLLLVGDRLINRENNNLALQGFSVSSFTWTQLDAMASCGSLFIQHLKQEARIISDANNRLTSLLEAFQPERDQRSRIFENRALFELTAGTPNNVRTLGWAFDVLAVAVRNHAVLLAAQDETYLFSHHNLIRWLTSKFGLASSEASLLASLRPLKMEYRTSGRVLSAGSPQLAAVQAIIERIFFVSCAKPPQDLLEFAQQRAASIPSDNAWYLTLRSYEGALRSMSSLLTAEQCAELHNFEQLIRMPSPYVAMQFGGLSSIQNMLCQLLESYNN